MRSAFALAVLFASGAVATISPSTLVANALSVKPVPGTGHNPATITQNYTVPHVDGKDDSPTLIAALATGKYKANSTILFKAGVTYNIWTPIVFTSLTNVEIAIEGNLTLPTNITTVQNIVASSSFPGYWFKVTGTNVTLRGTLDTTTGYIDSHGSPWWDVQQQTNRPHLVSFSASNSVIRYMKIKDSIGWNFALGSGTNIHAYGNLIDIQARSGGGFPFNTDGFGASGTNILIEANVITNGDDCITVGSGGSNIHVRNMYCANGHGLSIGSLGKGGSVASVHNVLFEDASMVNELYGARFKSWTGGAGLAENITRKNIAVTNVPFPIYVTQNYWDQGSGTKPNTTNPSNTKIDNFQFLNFTGTQLDKPYKEATCITDPCWYAVTNATGHEIVIFDLYPGTATNIVTQNLTVKTETGTAAAVMCDPATITTNPGFKCWDGAYIPA